MQHITKGKAEFIPFRVSHYIRYSVRDRLNKTARTIDTRTGGEEEGEETHNL